MSELGMMPELLFDADSHRYTYDGRAVPNVTRILEEEGLVDFSAVPEPMLRDSQWRGSAVHHACLLDDEGDLDESTVEPDHRGYLEAWRKCKANVKPEILAAETRLFNSCWVYAGTPDRLVQLLGKPRPQLWDLKTGIVQKAARFQTAAYVKLLRYIPGFWPTSDYEYDRYAVRLMKDGNYVMQEHPLRDLHGDMEMFLAALRINRYKKENCR